MNFKDAQASKPPSQTSFMIKVRIKRNDGSWFNVEVNKYGTILSLKEIIYEKTGYIPENQRLVFAGKILNDEMTLTFYKISENSQVYLVPKKTPNLIPKQLSSNTIINPRPKPIQLLNKMMMLLRKFRDISAEEYTTTISEITEIINDPTVQSFSRINEDAKQLLKDAQNIIANSERPMSQKTKYFIAKSKDFVFDQFDSTPEGFRILQSLVNEDSESSRSSSLSSRSSSPLSACSSTSLHTVGSNMSDNGSNKNDVMSNYDYHNSNLHENINKTNIKYKPLISTRPLPRIWSDSSFNDNEEPIKRVKLTRAPGMSFTLLMQSESSSENDDNDDEHNSSFKFEPTPSQTNSSSKVSPTAIPAVQLPPKGNNARSKRSVFQRAALRMSAPIAPIIQANGKNPTNNINTNSNSSIKLNEQKSNNLFSVSSPKPISAETSKLSQSKEAAISSTSKISILPSNADGNDVSINNNNIKIFSQNLNDLAKKSVSSPVSDSPLSSEENLQVVKAKSTNNCSSFSIPLKSKFAEQLVALKKMGFDDENIIVQALNETNGNIQLAVQLLKNKFT